ARISSSARQLSTRSISVSSTTWSSAVAIVFRYSGKAAARISPWRGISADLPSEFEGLSLRQPPLEPERQCAAHPEQNVPVDEDRLFSVARIAVEVREHVWAAAGNPEPRLLVDLHRLDRRLGPDELPQRFGPGAELREHHCPAF